MDHQMPWFNCFDGQINRDCLMLGGKVSISNEDLRDLVKFGHDLHIDGVDLAIFVKDNGFEGWELRLWMVFQLGSSCITRKAPLQLIQLVFRSGFCQLNQWSDQSIFSLVHFELDSFVGFKSWMDDMLWAMKLTSLKIWFLKYLEKEFKHKLVSSTMC